MDFGWCSHLLSDVVARTRGRSRSALEVGELTLDRDRTHFGSSAHRHRAETHGLWVEVAWTLDGIRTDVAWNRRTVWMGVAPPFARFWEFGFGGFRGFWWRASSALVPGISRRRTKGKARLLSPCASDWRHEEGAWLVNKNITVSSPETPLPESTPNAAGSAACPCLPRTMVAGFARDAAAAGKMRVPKWPQMGSRSRLEFSLRWRFSNPLPLSVPAS